MRKESKRQKKALMVYQDLTIGGVERNIVNFFNFSKNPNLDLRLVLMNRRGRLVKELKEKIKTYDLGLKSKFSLFRQVIGLKNIVSQWQPDVLVTIFDRMTIVGLMVRCLFGFKYKLIVIFPSYFSIRFRYMKLGLLRKKLSVFIFKQTDIIIVRSRACKEDLVNNFGFESEKIKVVLNAAGIKNVKFWDKKLLEDQKIKFVYLGRLVKIKGLEVLLRSVKKLVDKKITNFEVLIVGSGNYKNNLVSLVSQLKLKSFVSFKNFTSRVGRVYQESHVLVLPSFVEGCPLTILEAKSFGLPVIISNFFGAKEIVENGEDGLIFRAGDSDELCLEMEKVIVDEDFREKLAKKSLESIGKFSMDKFIGNQENIILNV